MKQPYRRIEADNSPVVREVSHETATIQNRNWVYDGRMIFQLGIILLAVVSLRAAPAFRGAMIPWTTYEAEDMATTGEKLGPKYETGLVESESSGQKCVRLANGQFVEFTAKKSANALVLRYNLPDSPDGGGIDSTVSLYQNNKLIKTIPITSRYSWLYGNYPFSNDPKAGSPRNFFDEARLKDLSISKGDVLRLQKNTDNTAPYCILDLVDLENAAPPLMAPANSLAITDARFGAVGNGEADDTAALIKCIQAASSEAKTVWLPAGTFKITGDIDVPSGATIQGAGMWHTTLVGDAAQYVGVFGRVRLNGQGSKIHLSDFAIIGKLNYRKDNEPNDGIGNTFGVNSSISRIWIEHTKTGIWVNNSSNLVVEGCRFRNTIADGVNFCVGMSHSTITNCTARGTGDDCFAIWPATHAPQEFDPGFNKISYCTAQTPFLANGTAIYGGKSNRVEDCLIADIPTGCGILLSTTFPTANTNQGVDNNFSGTTVVQDCDLIRSGGFDPWRTWRAALQVCLDGRDIAGVEICNLNIKDSISDGLSIVGPGKGQCRNALTNATLANVNIPNFGIGAENRHGLWIRNDVCGGFNIRNSEIVEQENNSPDFIIHRDVSTANSKKREQKEQPKEWQLTAEK
jgi:hypothetical protein